SYRSSCGARWMVIGSATPGHAWVMSRNLSPPVTDLPSGVGSLPPQVWAEANGAAARRALATIRWEKKQGRRGNKLPAMLELPVGGLLIGCRPNENGSVFRTRGENSRRRRGRCRHPLRVQMRVACHSEERSDEESQPFER